MDEDWETEDETSWIDWLKNHWESIALHIIVWSLLIIAFCSLIQLFITLKST